MTAFAAHIQTVVNEFLETALVVDDEAGLPDGVAADPADGADSAGREAEPMSASETAVTSRIDLELEEPSDEELWAAKQEHPLMSRVLLDAFAEMGIVCSLLAPLKGDTIMARFLKVAKRADLLVLDYELHSDGGSTARQLLKAIFDQDAQAERKRLRVIAIYTAQPGLVAIMDEIRKHLELDEQAVADEGATLAQDNLRITAFSKPLRDRLPEAIQQREVAESDLPARLAVEFAQLTAGLVPAVALAALSAVRNDTHRILQALPSALDVGYLGHRAASSFPEDTQGHLVELIAAEIGSVLSEGRVGAYADLDVIEAWLAAARDGEPPLVCGSALDPKRSFDEAQITGFLKIGLGLDEELGQHVKADLSEKKLKQLRKKSGHLFANDATVADESVDRFGLRMAVRTAYSRPRRILRLGTIVQSEAGYLVCLQPRCDSIRLTVGVPRGYPFLPLKIVGHDEAKRHDFVVEDPDSNSLARLQIQTKPFDLVVRHFVCGAARYVEAELMEPGKWQFSDVEAMKLRWIAELKPEFAQRVAVNLGALIARVGLAESELIRLSQD